MPETLKEEHNVPEYIGDCSRDCGRPATVRVHKQYMLCSFHELERYITDEVNDCDLSLSLLKDWASQAEHHGCGFLEWVCEQAKSELDERKEIADVQLELLGRAEEESKPEEEFRLRMGKTR